jgi:hypothetical protein
MSEDKPQAVVVAADMFLLSQIRSTPVGRRGGDATSDRGKIREHLVKVLDGLLAGKSVEDREIELTDVVTHFRQMALQADGKTVVLIPNGEKLAKGQRWFFVPDTGPTDERYRKIRTYITGLLKSRKEFVVEEKYSTRHGKDLHFIIYKVVKAVAAPKK